MNGGRGDEVGRWRWEIVGGVQMMTRTYVRELGVFPYKLMQGGADIHGDPGEILAPIKSTQ